MMKDRKGTIYLRDNNWYRSENVIKLGISEYAKDRSSSYITGEVVRGEYISVIEIPFDKMSKLDKDLKSYFQSYHINRGGGTEFYNRRIIDQIEKYIKKLNIEYRVLTKEEILLMNRCERNIPSYDIYKKIQIIPNEHQQSILNLIEGFFKQNDIGKIIWACGLGKALLSILIVKLLKFKLIAFGVPSNHLQKQIKNEILKIFPNKNNILFIGGDEDYGINSTTDKPKIISFIATNLNNEPKFVISTYHSCHLLVDDNIKFDFKIGDEAHHLVGIEGKELKSFRLFHKINSDKSLFMTATEKTIEIRENNKDNKVEKDKKKTYSMEDEAFFGKYIDVKTVYWAIENKKITDYNILVLKNTENQILQIINTLKITIINKEIFISCYMCLKSLEKYKGLTHILLYTNTIEDAELAKQYIDKLLKLNILSMEKDKIYNNALHSKNCIDINNEVNIFKNASIGIISCVYIFGEGFDLPKLNGVCIASNMQSEIRIIQYLLRPNRLEVNNLNKIAYIIVPYIDWNDIELECKSYNKIKTIISQLRSVDEKVDTKVLVYTQKNPGGNNPEIKPTKNIKKNDFEENTGELDKIRIRLRYSKALDSKFTEEQDEYNYVRSINTTLNIKSKKEYTDSQNHHKNYIDSPEEYFKSRGVWDSWYDFMGLDTTNLIQSKQEWKIFCKKINIKSLDDYYMSCDKYDILPKEPGEFYRDFSGIPNEIGFDRNRRF